MRVAVMAAGGVGGYLGSKLVGKGHEVAMIARGAHLEAIRANGLAVDTDGGTFIATPSLVTDDPAEVGPVDVVVFAVKLPHTDAAAQACRPLIGADTVVIPFQNGVESPATLARLLGPAHAAAGCGYIAISIVEPGRLRKVGELERFLFGEADGGQSARIEAFRSALVDAGVNAPVPEDIHVEVWRKFAFLAALSGMTAASRAPIGVIRDDEAMRNVFRRAVNEVVEVARARGIAVPEDLTDQHMAFIAGLPHEMTASQAHDLAAGRPLEIEGLSGAVVRLGGERGVDTPVHAALHAVLRPFAAGGRPSS
jgi:2-dehydropantoate 2-reductase